ncbi:MAG: peptidylprolyl isomerase [Bdellovibrionales bacterium]|nr:peptidylprolyl isomerase [Bdellovibrionales bacterium]
MLTVCLFSILSFAKNPQVELKTNKGAIVVELNQKKAPLTVKNFLSYVKNKQYDGTIFHRVIDGFMIQGGGFDKDMNEKATKSPIKNEANNGLSNEKYTIAMARTSDPDSATAQFFINVKDNPNLDYSEFKIPGSNEKKINHGYAVFGKVTKGQDIVDLIKKVSTGTKNVKGIPYDDVPNEIIKIESAKVLK